MNETAQDVTRLRKSGELEAAVTLARRLLREDPDNVWNKRAMGWCLYEQLKRINTPEDIEACGREFQALGLPPDDEMMWENWNRIWSEKSDPELKRLLEMVRDREADPGQVLILCRENREKVGPHVGLASATGWAMVRFLQKDSAGREAQALFDEYLEHVYPQLSLPCLLHSVFLNQLCAYAAEMEQFVSGFLQAGLGNLREEDWERRSAGEDRDPYPALVETIAKAVAKSLDRLPLDWTAEKESAQCRALHRLADWMGQVRFRYQDNVFLPYYEAAVLLRLGDPVTACRRMKKVVREKAGEGWAWQRLAQTFPASSEERLACLEKALSCHGPEEFKVGMMAEAAQAWAEQNRLPEANARLLRSLQIRESRGWRIPQELGALALHWSDADSAEPSAETLRTLFGIAHASYVEEEEWREALLVKRYTNKREQEMAVLIFEAAGNPVEVHAKGMKFPELSESDVGTPFDVALADPGSGARPRVLAVRARDAGLWDAKFCKSFEGRLQIKERGFGFVGSVFVPAELIQEAMAYAEDPVSGIAIRNWDSVKEVMGWKAVMLECREKEVPF